MKSRFKKLFFENRLKKNEAKIKYPEYVQYYKNVICPYCKTQLEKVPVRKLKCKQCGNSIFAKIDPVSKDKILATNEIVNDIEKFYARRAEENFSKECCEQNGITYEYFLSVRNEANGKPYDILWGLLSEKSDEFYDQLMFASLRTLRWTMFRILEREGNNMDALEILCEAIYYDVNGATDRGILEPADLAEEFPPFDLELSFIGPAWISYIIEIMQKLNMDLQNVKEMYIDRNHKITNKYIPLNPEKAWLKLEKELQKKL